MEPTETIAGDIGKPTPLDTAVVIVNYRTMTLTREAIASVLSEPEVTEVIVVDNASRDGSAGYLRGQFADERLRIIESPVNRGFGAGVNVASASCVSTFMLILNSDATLTPSSLGRMIDRLAKDEAIGVVAPIVYGADGHTPQRGAYGSLPKRRDIVGTRWARRPRHSDPAAIAPGWVSGVAMLLRRRDFVALGGFDEGYTMYFEDLDLCRRLVAAGKFVRREPSAGVVHQGGESWGSTRDQKRRFHQSKLRYFESLGASRLELGWVRAFGAIRTSLIPRGR